MTFRNCQLGINPPGFHLSAISPNIFWECEKSRVSEQLRARSLRSLSGGKWIIQDLTQILNLFSPSRIYSCTWTKQNEAWDISKFKIFNPKCQPGAKFWVWATGWNPPNTERFKKNILEHSWIIPALKIRGEHCRVTEEGKQGRERQDGLDPWTMK